MTAAHKETWFVIADGMRAKILRQTGADQFAPATDHDFYDADVHGHSRDLKSSAPGRAFDTGSGAHHSMEPRHDPHKLEKERFGRHVAAAIDEAAARGAFNRLILVAPPRALGILRDALGHQARACVVAEIAKDLVRTPLGELAGHFRDVPLK